MYTEMKVDANYRELPSDRNDNGFPFYYYWAPNLPGVSPIPLHWHNELEFVLCHAEGTAEIDGIPYTYHDNDIIFVNSGQLHYFLASSAGFTQSHVLDAHFLDFKINDFCQAAILDNLNSGEYQYPTYLPASHPCNAAIGRLIGDIVYAEDHNIFGKELHIKSLLYEMIFLLYSNNLLVTRAPRKGSQMDYVKTALIYLSENISNEVNLDDIARQANISRYYLIKIFKDVVGQTPMEYLINLRMEKAATLLMEGYNVTETALRIGMPNLSYFVRRFKQHFQVTPKAYQHGKRSVDPQL